MAGFVAKSYQQQALDSLLAYLKACRELGDADTAFYQTTRALWGQGVPYRPLAGFNPAMPYFCLRIPTGGGKTWLAARSIGMVNAHLLHVSHSVVLWLVPSNAIREQTLKALKDPRHPYHAALSDAGPVTVMDIDEAKSVTPGTLSSNTVIIVCTRQAFQVEETESRKVYESSGALMGHFDNLAAEQKEKLLHSEDGATVPYSLANVLRLHRPFVIVDEAHNNRTPLGFETLRRVNPSGILELTATPDTTHTPSNVLHSVWAAELKAEEMIKLPIRLETQPEWQKCLNQAIAWRDELQGRADAERLKGASPIRPIVLIQAEPRRSGHETLDVETLWQELQDNHQIPVECIARATSEYKELEALEQTYAKGIMDPDCPVTFVITQRALAEGWDCPWAYILVSMAELHSSTAVEQLLGRVLRQPEAKDRPDGVLNQSYAYVVSRSFRDTADSLRDSLVKGAGFERREAREFVEATQPQQTPLDFERFKARSSFTPIPVTLTNKPAKRDLNKLGDKVAWEPKTKTLTIQQPLDDADAETASQAVASDEDREAVGQAVEESRKQVSVEHFQTPSELGKPLVVPQMGLRVQGELQLFDDPEVLNYPWDISLYDADPTTAQRKRLEGNGVAEVGQIDTDDNAGRLNVDFMKGVTHDLALSYQPEHFNAVDLAAWLCRNLPDQTLTHESKRAFVTRWVQGLLKLDTLNLAYLNSHKFLLREMLEQRVGELRQRAVKQAYQDSLFDHDKKVDVVVGGAEMEFEFPPYGYAPSRVYDDRFGHINFRHHYYGQVGDFDSKEEFECAVWLDDQARKGNIEFWVRNLDRKPACAFFLQKADGKFWPDFICKLPDGTILVIEYKGGDRYSTDKAKEDRMIGELWAKESQGRARFVMVTNRDWGSIVSLM
ncbi:DEAD/DEAH box helicase [Chromohalobacter japonicus]|uniref:DEAD/DEAH box helicase n=1 Tax=Chromohalobacter japonicus TaxID=223900 RepID=UPI000590E6B3|nr:DEAD/DEAH box helicase family protein [Chromohalobacter japonicus]